MGDPALQGPAGVAQALGENEVVDAHPECIGIRDERLKLLAADRPGTRPRACVEQRRAIGLLLRGSLRGAARATDRGPGAEVELVEAVVRAGRVDRGRVTARLARRDRVERALGDAAREAVFLLREPLRLERVSLALRGDRAEALLDLVGR